jgi:hypothetical protein
MDCIQKYDRHVDKFSFISVGTTGVLKHLPSGGEVGGIPTAFARHYLLNIIAGLKVADLKTTSPNRFTEAVRVLFEGGKK